MNLKIVYGFQHVTKVTAFDLWPFDLVKSNIHGLHSLQHKECQKSKKKFTLSHFALVDSVKLGI